MSNQQTETPTARALAAALFVIFLVPILVALL
jgi:hypothetical protein